jgi:spore coat polysaccharide biosynthesis protein SpsF
MKATDHFGAQALVLDVCDDLPLSAVEKLREQGILIVTLADSSERRLAADLAFCPPAPQVQRLDWTGFTGQLYVGWEWVVLRREFAQRPPRACHQQPMVLVTMGGSDPAGLTMKAVEALDLLDEGFETVVVLGPAFSHQGALRDLLAKTHRHFDVRQNVTDMPGLMAQADLAVASFGVTAYELAAMGVPAIYLCLTQDHAESASTFVDAGIGLCLGISDQITVPMLVGAIKQILNDVSGRSRRAERARQQVDGKGAERIARIIAQKLSLPCAL